MLTKLKAKDIMRKFPAQLSPEDPAHWARTVMESHGVHHLPVTINGLLLGLVSRAESIAATLSGRAGYLTALEFMRKNPVRASPDACLGELSRALIAEGHDCIPIVSEHDEVLGAVHVHDVLRELYQYAGRVENVLLHPAWIPSAA